MNEPPLDLGDPSQVKKASRRARLLAREEDGVLAQVLSTIQGRRLMWRWLSLTGLYRNPFSTNALAMAFNAGQQNVGQQLLAEVNRISPEAYVLMMREANDGSSAAVAGEPGTNAGTDADAFGQPDLFGEPDA